MKSPQKRIPDRKTAQPSRTKQVALQTGQLAETFVAHWLTLQGGTVLYQRWHCPYGELDVVATLSDAVTSDALTPDALIFVEVKARSKGNWDENGLLSITPQKQAKLWQAAELFLADHPHLADLPCRFDIALLSCKPVRSTIKRSSESQLSLPLVIELGQAIVFGGFELTLQQYIVNAFSEI
ncbi:YraN family protein [Leptolyngbya ohadii]|uniref:YraN family protein n=1 Tax=Leptolyngbya ohadii TaxID=1962290 RepID=UPI000B59BF76|nr:YraN family protein [Leptolyngbya ohadii]